jgi:hypothetical protein
MGADCRIDIQGTESELVRYHKYEVGSFTYVIEWATRMGPAMAAIYRMPMKLTFCLVGPDAPPVSETQTDMYIVHPDGSIKELI